MPSEASIDEQLKDLEHRIRQLKRERDRLKIERETPHAHVWVVMRNGRHVSPPLPVHGESWKYHNISLRTEKGDGGVYVTASYLCHITEDWRNIMVGAEDVVADRRIVVRQSRDEALKARKVLLATHKKDPVT